MIYHDEYIASMERLEAYNHKRIDLFITSAHVDERSFSAYELLHRKGITIVQTVVFDYSDIRPKEDSDAYNQYYRLQSFSGVTYIPCNAFDADINYICNMDISSIHNIVIDITNIPTPDIFRLLYVLYSIHNVIQYSIVYSEPKYYQHINGFNYSLNEKLVEIDYRTIPEYFCSAVSRDVMLVCFLGFGRLVSKYIHDRCEHSDVVVINGFPSYYPKIKDISLEHNYELISAIGTDKVLFCQANDPFSSYNTLCDIKAHNNNKLMDICVLGSKPMALGACIFALKNQNDVKVSFPFPKETAIRQSLDVSEIWWYRITI